MTLLELTNTTHLFHKQKYVPVVTPSTSTQTKTPTSTTPATTKNDSKSSDTNTTSSGTQSANGTTTISRVGQSAGTISLRTVVNGINSGNCIVVFSKTGQPDVQQTVAVITNASYYSCAGVDVPVSQFSVSGMWNVSVHVVDSQSATISNVATWNDIQVQK